MPRFRTRRVPCHPPQGESEERPIALDVTKNAFDLNFC